MTLRFTLSLLACTALAATFAGCGSSDTPEEASKAPAVSKPKPAGPDASPAVSKPEAAGPAAAFRSLFDAMRDGNPAAFAEHATERFLEGSPSLEEFGTVSKKFRDTGFSFALGEVREEGDTATVRVIRREAGERRDFEGVARRIYGVWKVDEIRSVAVVDTSEPEAGGPDAAFRAIFNAMRDGDAAAFAEHSTAHFLEDFLPIEEFGRAAQEFRDAGISFTLGEVREEGDTAVVGVTLRDGDGETENLEGVAKRIDGVWKVDEMRASGAERMQVANNGKQIVMAIISANIDRTANMLGEVWPGKGGWQDSNAYFAKLMGDGRKAILTGLSFSTFAGGGVDPAADMTEFKTKGNAWNMLAGIANCADARTPFMWTRNLRLTQADLEAYARNPDAERSLADRLDPSVDPFGDEGVAVISKGAAMFWIPAAELTTRTFFGGVELDPSAVEIVEALPD